MVATVEDFASRMTSTRVKRREILFFAEDGARHGTIFCFWQRTILSGSLSNRPDSYISSRKSPLHPTGVSSFYSGLVGIVCLCMGIFNFRTWLTVFFGTRRRVSARINYGAWRIWGHFNGRMLAQQEPPRRHHSNSKRSSISVTLG